MADGSPPGSKVRESSLQLQNERLRTLFQHPNSRVLFDPIHLGESPRLQVAVGLTPKAWESGSDGVRFRVLLAGAPEQILYDHLIEADDDAEPQPWLHVEISLAERAGQVVELIFETSSGPLGDADFDWAHWVEPRLVMTGPGRPGPNLLLISMDTLRADVIGAFGGRQGVTPVMDRLAARGTGFQMALSTSAWTRPAHFSMLTGLYPDRRTLRYDEENCSLVPEVRTLAEYLTEANFTTAAFSGGGYVSAEAHFDQGFMTFETQGRRMEENLDAIGVWLARHGRERFFLFLHNFNAHRPYDPPVEFLQRLALSIPEACEGITFGKEQPKPAGNAGKTACLASEGGGAYLRAVYEAEAAYVDTLLGHVLEQLEELGILNSTLVVLASDHGEELLDHGGLDHIKTLYQEVARVPLIFAGPGVTSGNRIKTPVSIVDIVPTVLDLLLGLDPLGIHGEKLSPGLLGQPLARPPVFMATSFDPALPGLQNHKVPFLAAVVRDRWKLILRDGTDARRFELYDLVTDPEERHNLSGSGEGPEEELSRGLAAFVEALPEEGYCGQAAMPPELRAQLEALGYLEQAP